MNRRPKRHGADRRRGAAAVEFAFAITILLLLVFACVEFVRLSILRHSVEHASYLGARNAMIAGATASAAEAVANQHLDIMEIGNRSVTVTPSKITDDTQVIEVVVTVPVSGNSWVSPVYFSGSLTGKTRMLTERAAAKMGAAIPAPGP